jgi:hypothetical protein
MKKRSKPNNAVDTVAEKKRRGPKRRLPPGGVVGTADLYNVQFRIAWEKIGRQLLEAADPEEVLKALTQLGGSISGTIDLKFANRVFTIIHDPAFPEVRDKSQIRFLADSLGGGDALSPRRSRDICAQERAKRKKAQHILRYEYYVECSCGYKGHSLDHACKKCGATIVFEEGLFRSFVE